MSRLRARSAPLLAAVLAMAGCNSQPPTATIAPPSAPAAPPVVEAATLPKVKFVDITKESGIHFVHNNAAKGEKLLPETIGSGVAFLDYDGDGDQDLFFVNSEPWPGQAGDAKPTQALYRNDGKGHFEDVTKPAGLDRTFFGMGVAVGDYDGDGDPDLYVTAVGGGHLFRNDGGTFAEVTDEANAHASDGWLTSAAFFDMENDGDLDLFVCQYVQWSPEIDRKLDFQLTGQGRGYGPPSDFNGSYCVLLRNDGGKFADVSESAGIRIKTPLGDPLAKALGVAPFDVNGDGLVDLAVSNDTVQNFLFENKGDGKFEEVGVVSGVAYDAAGAPRAGMGIDWAHFRNDRGLALTVGNFANEMTALFVADDPASAGLQFTDQAPVFGLGAPTQPPLKFGLFFFDYDLDGRLDLLSVNGHLESDIAKVQASQSYRQSAQLFWNSGRGKPLFVPVGPDQAGPDLFIPIVGRGSAFADIDGDGDLDLVLTDNGGPGRLFRNDGGSANHWLRLKLSGTKPNPEAIGAKVALKAGGHEQLRQLFPAKGYLSSVELPLTFGLGKAESAEAVRIVWPSGKTTELKDLKAGRLYIVDEKEGLVEPK